MAEFESHPGAAPMLPSMPSPAGFSSLDMFRAMQIEQSAQRMATQAMMEPQVAMMMQMQSGQQISNWESAMRVARPLAQDAQIEFDEVIVRVGPERLAVAAELLRRGLTKPLPNWLARRTMQWDVAAESGTAIEFMDPRTDFPSARRDRTPDTIPIPGIMEGARFGIRELLQSRLTGDPIDTDRIREATLNVNLTIEDRFVNGGGVVVGGAQAFGFLNHPDAVSVPYTGGLSWTNVGHSAADKVTDVRNQIKALRDRNRNGPYVFVVNGEYEHELGELLNPIAPTEGTIRDQLERQVNNGAPLTIIASDALPTDRTFLFEASLSICDVIEGQQPTSTSWTIEPGWESWVVVMACMILRIKKDAKDFVGIATGDLT